MPDQSIEEVWPVRVITVSGQCVNVCFRAECEVLSPDSLIEEQKS